MVVHVCMLVYACVCACACICLYGVCVCVYSLCSISPNSFTCTCIVSIKQCTVITLSLQPYSFLLQEAAENPHWIAPAYKEYVATIQILYVLHVALASLMLNVCNDWNSAMVLFKKKTA